MKYKSHILRLVGLSVGAVIFIYTINSFGGFQKVFSNLAAIKYFYVLVVLNSFLWMVFYTEAWSQLIADVKHKVRFISLLKIKMSGEAVNFMTPIGFIAGDPVRVLLLKKFVGPEARLRSVVIDRLMHTLSAEVFCAFGLLLVFTQKINFPLFLHLSILTIYIVLCLFFLVLIYSMMTGRGFGFFERIFHVLKLEKRAPKLDQIVHELREDLKFYQDKPKGPFVYSFLCHLAGRFLGAVEIMIVFYCYAGKADLVFSLILASLSSFFSIVMGWIPGAFGALEYVYAQFFMLYGFSSDLGVSVQIVRRLRVFFWIAVGVLVLDYTEIGNFFHRFKKKKLGQDHQ